MSLVTYAAMGTATGVSHPRDGGELLFGGQPASFAMSYTYDAGSTGTVHDGTTIFTVPDLDLRANVPGYFRADVSPGTISWTGDTIRFNAAYSAFPGAAPDALADVRFPAGGLTPGMLPASLAGLEGVMGQFHYQIIGTLDTRSSGEIFGYAAMAPEPSTAVLLLLGIIGCVALGVRRRKPKGGGE